MSPSTQKERLFSEDQASKMEDQRVEVVVESRKEAIFPPVEGEPITRRAYFLHPYIGGPSSSSSPDASPPSLWPLREPFDPKKWPISVHWKEPLKGWKPWVEKMQALHEETWRRAGIYEAITASTCRIIKDGDLVVGLAERWCPATNSFVFPWGEATVTLEDMAIIGGYSVFGSPVFCPMETEEMVAVQELLAASRLKMVRSSAQKATQLSWLREFKDGGSKIEHEAFLVCWLSRYVLATIKGAHDVISENTFPIAVLLARGTRVALAPAVLARIYNDMTLLKGKIDALTLSEHNVEGGDDFTARVEFPLQLVQVWAWERFLELQPEPNVIRSNDALLAKWDKVKPIVKAGNMRLLLDSSKGKFTWRPYAKSVNHKSLQKVYSELGNQLELCSDSDEDLLAFARFLRVSELVGMGCMEQYLPQRMAMQFGFDQDVPFRVRRCNGSPEIAWRCYDHSEKELMCDLPSSLDGARVTARYLEWWQSSVGVHQCKHIRVPRQKKTAIGRMGLPKSCVSTPMAKKAWRAGSSADRDANGGAKLVSSFTITPKINTEWRAASFAKRLKVPVSKTSREMKEKTSMYLKGKAKTSNGPKHGRNFISSFKIRPKNSNTSATSRERGALVLPTSPGFLKKSSDVAGSSQKHNENIPSANRREGQAQALPSSDVAGMQNTSIPSPPRMTREGSSFKPESKKSLVRILFVSQNLAQRLKRKRLENSKSDARAVARKIARTSAVFTKCKELKEIYKCSVPPGFQSKDLYTITEEAGGEENTFDQSHDLPPVAVRDTSLRAITGVEIADLEKANAAEVGHGKASTSIQIIDVEKIIDLEEEEVLGDNGSAISGGEVGRNDVRMESEVNVDRQLLDNLDTLRPELAARIRSLKADFARLIAKRMQQ